MKYETPELTALTPAINAIQITPGSKVPPQAHLDTGSNDSFSGAYEDWEE